MMRASFLITVIVGAIVGGIVGGFIGGFLGFLCIWLVVICGPAFTLVGGSLGGIAGGVITGTIHTLIAGQFLRGVEQKEVNSALFVICGFLGGVVGLASSLLYFFIGI